MLIKTSFGTRQAPGRKLSGCLPSRCAILWSSDRFLNESIRTCYLCRRRNPAGVAAAAAAATWSAPATWGSPEEWAAASGGGRRRPGIRSRQRRRWSVWGCPPATCMRNPPGRTAPPTGDCRRSSVARAPPQRSRCHPRNCKGDPREPPAERPPSVTSPTSTCMTRRGWRRSRSGWSEFAWTVTPRRMTSSVGSSFSAGKPWGSVAVARQSTTVAARTGSPRGTWLPETESAPETGTVLRFMVPRCPRRHTPALDLHKELARITRCSTPTSSSIQSNYTKWVKLVCNNKRRSRPNTEEKK